MPQSRVVQEPRGIVHVAEFYCIGGGALGFSPPEPTRSSQLLPYFSSIGPVDNSRSVPELLPGGAPVWLLRVFLKRFLLRGPIRIIPHYVRAQRTSILLCSHAIFCSDYTMFLRSWNPNHAH